MSIRTLEPSTSTCDADRATAVTDDGGPLVNGRPVLTIQDVQNWCRSAHLPELSDASAAEVAQRLNHAAFLSTEWAPGFAELRRANPSMLRMRRIAEALAALRDDLPAVLADSRAIRPNGDLSLTETLFELVQKHLLIINKYKPQRGRPPNLAGNVATNVGKLLAQLYEPEIITAKARDAFVGSAIGWLLQSHPADSAISRNRRRRVRRM